MEAIEIVRDRLVRVTAALESASIPYAVIGGNAVAAWVGKVDRAAVRFTRDVDVLLRRDDLEAAKLALAPSGFTYRHVRRVDMFLDGPDSTVRDAVHVIFAGEKVRDADEIPAPLVTDSEVGEGFRVLGLEALVRMKLTAFRDKTHLRDMLDVGLIDASWLDKLTGELQTRLRSLIDNPED